MSNHFDYEINKELGECYLFMGELEKAEGYYVKAAESKPEYSAPYLGLATIAIQQNELDKALSHYEKACEVEYGDKPLTGIGLVLMEQGKNEEAFNKFEEALSLNQSNMVSLSCIVRLGYMLNRVEALLPILERAVEVDESQSSRITLAGCLISLDKNNEAAEHLKKALIEDPTQEQARELLEHIQ